MTFFAAVLSVLLATQSETPKPNPELQRELTTFVEHVKASRLPEAYAFFSTAARKQFGPAQFAAYVASRRRALGALQSVSNIRVSNIIETEHGMTIYDAAGRFEKGQANLWFVLTHEEPGWRIQTFGINLPEGTKAPYAPEEMPPVAHEILAALKSEGALALADRFSDKDLAAANQTREAAHNAFLMLGDLLGGLQSYTLGDTTPDEEATCQTIHGSGKFEHGAAPITLRLCWEDGVWRLRHAEITPQLDAAMLERSLEWALKGNVKAKCPRDAAFPIGGSIVCRITPAAEPAQDATILRTTETAWKIVGLNKVK